MEWQDVWHVIGSLGALIVMLAASMAIYKWGMNYKVAKAKVATVIMLAGLWLSIGRPGALIIFLAGLIMMLVVRKQVKNAATKTEASVAGPPRR
jgi:chromate transport protein ChrA